MSTIGWDASAAWTASRVFIPESLAYFLAGEQGQSRRAPAAAATQAEHAEQGGDGHRRGGLRDGGGRVVRERQRVLAAQVIPDEVDLQLRHLLVVDQHLRDVAEEVVAGRDGAAVEPAG